MALIYDFRYNFFNKNIQYRQYSKKLTIALRKYYYCYNKIAHNYYN